MEIEQALKFCEQHKDEIITYAKGGDKIAADIITFHRMFVACQEPGSMVFLCESVEKFKDKVNPQ